jgi:hypothetical protein
MPIWSATRNEIIYGFEGQLMVAPFAVTATHFGVATPHPWPQGRYQTCGRIRMFDPHPDGERLVLALGAASAAAVPKTTAQFVFNFFDELRATPEPRSTPHAFARTPSDAPRVTNCRSPDPKCGARRSLRLRHRRIRCRLKVWRGDRVVGRDTFAHTYVGQLRRSRQ